MEKFTKELCDLFVKKNLTLNESLLFMSRKPKGKTKKTAEYLYEALGKGMPLSNALKTCPYISFDSVYVTFILFAEKTGDLRKIIQYLDLKCKRHKENLSKVISAFIYPFFVVLSSIAVCVFLTRIIDIGKKTEVYKTFAVLIVICGLLFILIYKLIGDNKLYEAFLGTDILLKGGVTISAATTCGAMIAGINSKIGKSLIEAGEKIEYGMNLQSAFNFNNDFEEAFYYADVTGGNNDVFEKIAIWLEEKYERRRNICMQLVEPIFIAITGSFLLLLVINFFLPVLNDYSWL